VPSVFVSENSQKTTKNGGEHTKINADGALVNLVAHDCGCVCGWCEGERGGGERMRMRWGGGIS